MPPFASLTLPPFALQLLGYPTHAAFITEIRMAESPVRVAAFLDDLSAKLQPLQAAEMAEMVAMKNTEEGEGSDGVIHAYDFSYYRYKVGRTKCPGWP